MMTLNHHQPLIRFMGEAQRGVRGFVVDQAGRPLENVAMKIKGRDAPFQTTKHGEFWRILLPGYYRIEVIFLFYIVTS
jgi:carboxypeptidase M